MLNSPSQLKEHLETTTFSHVHITCSAQLTALKFRSYPQNPPPMASFFRPRHRRSPDEDDDGEPRGSGGKILRGRRAPPPASPYHRTPSRPPPPPSPRSPGWLSGILSGAGKLISNVFVSESSSQSYSDYTSGDDTCSDSGEDEDIDTAAEELSALNQGRNELIRNHGEASSAIVPKSESKLAIEQLLMQETFSRDECKKLMDILQSRVLECPPTEVVGVEDGRQKRALNNTSGSPVSFLGGQRSFNKYNELQDSVLRSSSILNSLSPGFPALQTRTPDRATAVMEAKKWLEEKKLTSSSKANLDCGPCTLNTNTLHQDIGGELGSPVDMAKSYMQSRPPWQSPSLCSIGFNTPPPSGTHMYKDRTYATLSNSLLSSKHDMQVLKRNYLSIESSNTLDDIRRVRMKSMDHSSENYNNDKNEPSTSLLDHKASVISSEVEKTDAEDHCTNGTLFPHEKPVEASRSMETGSITPVSIFSKFSEVSNAGQLTNEKTVPTSSIPSQSELGSKTKLPDAGTHILDENQDMEEVLQTNNSSSPPNEPPVLLSPPMEHEGGPLSETKKMLREEIKSADRWDTDVTNYEDTHFPTVRIISGVRDRPEADKLLQPTTVKEICPTAVSRPRDVDVPLQKEESSHKITVNGALGEYNSNSSLESLSKRGRIPTNSNINEAMLHIPKESSEPASNTAVDMPVHVTDSLTGNIQNGTRMKLLEKMPRESSSSIRRGKKAVVRVRRGRGKGK